MSLGKFKPEVSINASVTTRPKVGGHFGIDGQWDVECYRNGNIIWTDHISNVIVNSAITYLLGVGIGSSAQTSAGGWYLSLISTGMSAASGDTMASHAGWTECSAHTAVNRQVWQPDAVSGKTIDNSTNKASFTINATTGVGGAFMCSVASGGSAGDTLFAAGAFTGGDRALSDGDVIQVQAIFSGDGRKWHD